MKRLLIAALLAALPGVAIAQRAEVVETCGELDIDIGNPFPLQMDETGNLCVSSAGGGGGAVTQSGTWTVQPGNTANTTPWKVDDDATQSALTTLDGRVDGLEANTADLDANTDNLPTALGSAADAASLPVTQSTEDKAQLDAIKVALQALSALIDQGLGVELLDPSGNKLSYTPPASSTVTAVADAATTSTTCLASNANREGARFYNDTNQNMWILEDEGTASNTNFTVMVPPDGLYVLPMNNHGVYTDDVKCYWLTNTSDSVLVTEIAP